MATEKSFLSDISLAALNFPIQPGQQGLPRFDEVLQAMASNLDIQASSPAEWRAKMDEFADQNTIAFWLILYKGNCAGYVAVGYPAGSEKVILSGDDVALGWFVLPDFRGKGMAGKAVADILNYLRDIPVASVRVDIDDDNERSLNLARKFGFTVSGQGTHPDGRGWKSLLLIV